jgi:hypothetical protein
VPILAKKVFQVFHRLTWDFLKPQIREIAQVFHSLTWAGPGL